MADCRVVITFCKYGRTIFLWLHLHLQIVSCSNSSSVQTGFRYTNFSSSVQLQVFKKIAMPRYFSVESRGFIVGCRENGIPIRQIVERVNMAVSALINMQIY
jgi:hypothetical protein